MSPNKNLLWAAWTIPVSVDELGPKLETFNNTHKQITAFRICHQKRKEPNTILHKLPGELVNVFTDILHDTELWEQQRKWQRMLRCCQGNCRVKDHLTEAEIHERDALVNAMNCCSHEPDPFRRHLLVDAFRLEISDWKEEARKRHGEEVIAAAKHISVVSSMAQTQAFYNTYHVRPLLVMNHEKLNNWRYDTQNGLYRDQRHSNWIRLSVSGLLCLPDAALDFTSLDLQTHPDFDYKDGRMMSEVWKAWPQALSSRLPWSRMRALERGMEEFRLTVLDCRDQKNVHFQFSERNLSLYVFGTLSIHGLGRLGFLEDHICQVWHSDWWKIFGYDTIEFAEDVVREQVRRVEKHETERDKKGRMMAVRKRQARQKLMQQVFAVDVFGKEGQGQFGFEDVEAWDEGRKEDGREMGCYQRVDDRTGNIREVVRMPGAFVDSDDEEG